MVADDAAKILCWTETVVTGPGEQTVTLAAPPSRNGLHKEAAVLAIPASSHNSKIKNWELKTLRRPGHGGKPPAEIKFQPLV